MALIGLGAVSLVSMVLAVRSSQLLNKSVVLLIWGTVAAVTVWGGL